MYIVLNVAGVLMEAAGKILYLRQLLELSVFIVIKTKKCCSF